jgi:sugar/nucleoside kinase (ribokinase family)
VKLASRIAKWNGLNKKSMKKYDIVFIGHVTIDEIVAAEGSSSGTGGGAPLFGSLAAAVTGKNIAVITRIAREDTYLIEALEKAGVDVYFQSVPNTTHMRVVHPSANVDERVMYQTRDAGFFTIEEIPPLEASLVHLGALTDREFTLEFMQKLKERGFRLSVDIQGFVRQVDESTRIIRFGNVPEKRDIMGMVDFVKLDVVEAKILTGTDNILEAAAICEGWGSRETLITRSDGVLVRSKGKDYFEGFSNRSSAGRTGRGDTTFGAYLARRLDHSIEESIKFAASLASIKMETPGPFRGTFEDVIKRMGIGDHPVL